MLVKHLFSKDTPKETITAFFRSEGFEPKIITDPPHFIYKAHQHPETKLIVCLEGSMMVKVENKEYLFEPGDKLMIPGNTLHSAKVGPEGCLFFWSERTV